MAIQSSFDSARARFGHICKNPFFSTVLRLSKIKTAGQSMASFKLCSITAIITSEKAQPETQNRLTTGTNNHSV